jgi:Domain of unknown function (DUF1854)
VATDLRYLEPESVRAYRIGESSHLRIELIGELTILSADLKRAFPLSEPERLISISDGAGKEVGILTNSRGLEPETKRLFTEQLDRRYFTPRIEQIESLKIEAGMVRFVVATQRGKTQFYVRNWRDSANEIAPGRWQINSVDGGRFEIMDLESLDVASRRFMDLLL